MKLKYVFLSTILALALTAPLFGQHNDDDMTKKDMKKHEMSKMMGKPIVDATVEGLHMKVWLMTQKHHKKMMKEKMGKMMGDDMKGMKHDGMEMKDSSMAMRKDMMGMKHESMKMKDSSMAKGKDMKGMKHDGMEMNKNMMDSMMVGTHHIMLEITDAANRNEIDNASAKIMIVPPSKLHSSVDLKPMMMSNCFGAGLTLDKKGEYEFKITVNVDGVSKIKTFEYTVK
ncbi:MAG: hypothetical protein NTX65_11590 [Ignavibacteriales bacterium]|nr:hypothetical protein [Ignavibacteriales bacterium]